MILSFSWRRRAANLRPCSQRPMSASSAGDSAAGEITLILQRIERVEEAAQALGVAESTAKGWWAYARAWMTKEVRTKTACTAKF